MVDTLAHVVAELDAETLGAILGYVKSQPPVDTVADIGRGGGRDC